MRKIAGPKGCWRDLVTKKIKSGHLAILTSGTLDPSLVATAWNKTKELETKAAPIVAASPAIPLKFESEAKKERCLAKPRPLDLERVWPAGVDHPSLPQPGRLCISRVFARRLLPWRLQKWRYGALATRSASHCSFFIRTPELASIPNVCVGNLMST